MRFCISWLDNEPEALYWRTLACGVLSTTQKPQVRAGPLPLRTGLLSIATHRAGTSRIAANTKTKPKATQGGDYRVSRSPWID